MKKIILIRHGETAWNRERKIMGWVDIPLNEKGRAQAKQVGAALKELYNIESIYSSDLSRTVETAEIIKGIACPKARIEAIRDLREMNPGIFSGYKYHEFPPEMDIMKLSYEDAIDLRRTGGETLREFNTRVTIAFNKVLKTATEVSLISTHSGVVSTIIGNIKGYNPLESLLKINPKNCAFHLIDLNEENGEIRIENENLLVY